MFVLLGSIPFCPTFFPLGMEMFTLCYFTMEVFNFLFDVYRISQVKRVCLEFQKRPWTELFTSAELLNLWWLLKRIKCISRNEMDVSLLGARGTTLWFRSKMSPKQSYVFRGQVFLEGDWIMESLYSSMDQLVQEFLAK